MHKHVLVLAALYIGTSVMLAVVAGLIIVVLPMASVFVEDPEVAPILVPMGIIVGAFLFLLAVPGIVGGVGLLKRRPWARILVLVLGAIHLLNLPIGTALGVYTIWVLVHDETERLFARPATPPTVAAPAAGA